jgi:hypothetical protein
MFEYYASLVSPKLLKAFAVFLISGILHDLGSIPHCGYVSPLRVTGFFLLQFVGILIERIFGRTYKCHVKGVWGFLWSWTWLLLTGQLIVEEWYKRGVIGDVLSQF